MQQTISITAISSISPLGKSLDDAWKSYQLPAHCITEKQFLDNTALVAEIPMEAKMEIELLRHSHNKYKSLDNTVLYAIYAGRQAVKQAGWNGSDDFGINIGSSRGATHLFETYYESFLKSEKSETLCSPTTTLGNISSWVAHDLQTQGPEVSHSITCSTALHAMLNGIAWIYAGMCNKFLVGGSEAPLTPFTIAQMRALKIYAKENGEYPCRALDLLKNQNSMILGEAASMACLEAGIRSNALAVVTGFGYATELLEHNISISSDAKCFQKSMRMALANCNPEDVDVVVMHAPSTVKGDLSEFKAIEIVFKNDMPSLTTNKWKIGHTLGASGMLSIELAVLMLNHNQFVGLPFVEHQKTPDKVRNVLVNAVGFGGNAVSILLSKN